VGDSIPNEYFQADRQKGVLFAEWLILKISPYKELQTVSDERLLSTLRIEKENYNCTNVNKPIHEQFTEIIKRNSLRLREITVPGQ
jgi:hypothetical protein